MAIIRFVLISLFASALVAVPASAAPAPGSYRVYACKTPDDEPAPTDGWSLYAPSTVQAGSYNGCADGGSVGARIQGSANNTGGAAYGWAVDAPAGTRFAKVDLFRWAFVQPPMDGDTARPTAWIGYRSSLWGDAAWQACATGGPFCFGTGVQTDLHDDNNHLSLDVPHALGTRVAFLVGCTGSGSCRPVTTPEFTAQIAVQAATFTLTDADAPAVSAAPSGPLVGTGLHRGTESASFTATDVGGGVYRSMVDVRPAGAADWQTARSVVDDNGGHCAQLESAADDDYEFGYLAPCKPTASAKVALDTTKYVDGDYELRVRVEDAAGNETVVVPQTAFTIHNAPMVTPGTTSIGGELKTGTLLTANVGAWQGNDITYAIEWQRCVGEDPTACVVIPNATQAGYAPVTADLGRYLRLKVTGTNSAGSVTAMSELAGPVKNAAGKVPECADGVDNDADAKIDEADPGCRDRAGDNEAADRPQPTPTPTATSTSTAVPQSASPTPTPSATVRPTATPVSSPSQSDDGHHDITPSSSSSRPPTLTLTGAPRRTLRFGRGSSVTVSLRDGAGQPIAGARLDVLGRVSVAGADFRREGGQVVTDRDGVAVVPVHAGAGRTMRIAYTAGGGDGPADALVDLQVLVRSRTTLRKSRSFLHNGQTLHFSGRVQSRPVPARGVGIDLQAQVGKHWLTFKTLSTNAAGRWHSSYRFRSTSGLQTYRFRARIRGDSGFPYLPSTSKPITVKVKG